MIKLSSATKKTVLAATAALIANSAFANGLRLAGGLLAGATGVDVSSSSPSESVNLTENKKFGYGAGALLEVPIVNYFGLETGALYLRRRFDIGNDTVKITRTSPSLIIPVEARFWIWNIVTVAAGGFASIKAGDTTDKVRFGNASASNTFSTKNRKFAEYGLTFAAGVNLPIANKTGLFAEARYNHGLSNSADNGSFEEKIRDVIFMAGVRLDFGG